MEQFPGLASQMTPAVATESLMQLANVYRRPLGRAQKWGYHIMPSWKLFFDTGREIGQITGDFNAEDVVKNDLVDEANQFDAAKVKADAEGFALSDDYKAVDVDAIQHGALSRTGRGGLAPPRSFRASSGDECSSLSSTMSGSRPTSRCRARTGSSRAAAG